VNAEFQWWLLIVGMVIGGALVYLVLADLQGDDSVEADDGLFDDESGDEPGSDDQTNMDDAPAEARPDPAAASARAGSARSAGDVADVEGHGAESQAAVADPDESGLGHDPAELVGVREPLEGGG